MNELKLAIRREAVANYTCPSCHQPPGEKCIKCWSGAVIQVAPHGRRIALVVRDQLVMK